MQTRNSRKMIMPIVAAGMFAIGTINLRADPPITSANTNATSSITKPTAKFALSDAQVKKIVQNRMKETHFDGQILGVTEMASGTIPTKEVVVMCPRNANGLPKVMAFFVNNSGKILDKMTEYPE